MKNEFYLTKKNKTNTTKNPKFILMSEPFFPFKFFGFFKKRRRILANLN